MRIQSTNPDKKVDNSAMSKTPVVIVVKKVTAVTEGAVAAFGKSAPVDALVAIE
jgi:putative transposon-encoded protein